MDRSMGTIADALNPASYSQQMKTALHGELSQVLHRYPSLFVKCYPHSLNRSQVYLVQVEGILSVFFKKVKYNIPIMLVYPQGYPNDPPSLFVIPTQTMVLNLNNKSVSQDGKIALQVLKKWKKKPASLDILEEAKKLFEKDSPLFSTTGVVQLQSYPPQNSQPVNSNPTLAPSSSGIINSAFSALSSILSSGSSSNQSSTGSNNIKQNTSTNCNPKINPTDQKN